MKTPLHTSLLVGCALLATSCSLFGGNAATDRTYPHALDLEEVTIAALNRTVPLPGKYNIRGYVVSITACPPEALCLVADGISVFIRNEVDPEVWGIDGIYIVTDHPDQFRIGRQYVFSLEIKHERYPDVQPFAQILGYDRVR